MKFTVAQLMNSRNVVSHHARMLILIHSVYVYIMNRIGVIIEQHTSLVVNNNVLSMLFPLDLLLYPTYEKFDQRAGNT